MDQRTDGSFGNRPICGDFDRNILQLSIVKCHGGRPVPIFNERARPGNILQILLLSNKVYPHVLSDNEDELFSAQFSFSFKINKEKA